MDGFKSAPKEQGHSTSVDALAEFVQQKYKEDKEARQAIEAQWRDSFDADKAEYSSRVKEYLKAQGKEHLYVPITRRKKEAAVVKVRSHLMEGGTLPIDSQISKHFSPVLRQYYAQQEQVDEQQVDELLQEKADNLRDELYDILKTTEFEDEFLDSLPEQMLYGTTVLKAPVLQKVDVPSYQMARQPNGQMGFEQGTQSELMPTAERASIWDIFPSPYARNRKSLEHLIHRSFLPESQFIKLTKQPGYIQEAVQECIAGGEGKTSRSEAQGDNPEYTKIPKTAESPFEVLAYWGSISVKKLLQYMPIQVVEDEHFLIVKQDDQDVRIPLNEWVDVVLTICGKKVIKADLHPFDGEIPFYFAYWKRNPDSIWGYGIGWQLKDIQDCMNELFNRLLNGKDFSSMPMLGVNIDALHEKTDLKKVFPGMIIGFKGMGTARDNMQSITIPDVTGGLLEIIDYLERMADLITGLNPVAMGESAKYQSKTATGISILDANTKVSISEVVASSSAMLSGVFKAIAKWLVEHTEDETIKGDYEVKCSAYEGYISQVVQRAQLNEVTMVVAQVPDIAARVKWEEIAKKLFRSYGFEPEKLLIGEDEFAKQQQAQQQAQLESVQQLKALELKYSMLEAQFNAMLEEKQKIGEAERESRIKEREALAEKGHTLNRPDFTESSPLLREEKLRAAEAAQAQEEQIASDEADAQQAYQSALSKRQTLKEELPNVLPA